MGGGDIAALPPAYLCVCVCGVGGGNIADTHMHRELLSNWYWFYVPWTFQAQKHTQVAGKNNTHAQRAVSVRNTLVTSAKTFCAKIEVGSSKTKKDVNKRWIAMLVMINYWHYSSEVQHGLASIKGKLCLWWIFPNCLFWWLPLSAPKLQFFGCFKLTLDFELGKAIGWLS